MSTETDILCASHGNEFLGLVVHEMAPDGVRTRIAHPEAAVQGKRHLGPLQIMDCYPGNFSGDPEERAAAQNMLWFGDRAGSDAVAIYDIHNNHNPELHHMEVGSRALQATMVGGYALGYSICIVRPDSFYESVPNAAVLETPILNETEYRPVAEKLCRGLGKVARLGVDQLQSRYEEILPKLTFLRKYVITIIPRRRDEQLLTVSDPDLLERLEAIKPAPSFAEFPMDADLRWALGIPDDARLLMEGWGYENMSMELPDQGMFNGRPRKVALGSFFREIEPPVVNGKWVEFKAG